MSVNPQHIDVLHKVEILQGLDDQQLSHLLKINKILAFKKDNFIFQQNSDSTEMYIVLKGRVLLIIDPEMISDEVETGSIGLYPLGVLRTGEVFGELALFDKKPRSVSAMAAEDCELLAIPADFFSHYLLEARSKKQNTIPIIIHNVIKDIAKKLRKSNHNIINEMLSVYFIKMLAEELVLSNYECSLVNPLKRQAIIHLPEYFILGNFIKSKEDYLKKELIDIYFFSTAETIKSLLSIEAPTGEVIINTLFSIIRSGKVPQRVRPDSFDVRLNDPQDFRQGMLIIKKWVNNKAENFFLKWELKGIISKNTHQFNYANLFISIAKESANQIELETSNIIRNFLMPIQKSICSTLTRSVNNKSRLIVIHHRTNEVVVTLKSLIDLGYRLDAMIGIPYGDVDWRTIITLDYASNHRFKSLKTISDPLFPNKYVFDFKASSFLSVNEEKILLDLFDDPKINSSYMTAMQALAKYSLVESLKACMALGEKLIIYEDGAYIADIIYRAFHDKTHELHTLIKTALEQNHLIGIVEGTMSGERVHLKYLSEHNQTALLPILSSARSVLKIIFESKGIAESIIYSAATALGRMGLPAFQERKMVVIGGNGVIGRRVVEQFASMHNNTSDLTVADINPLQSLPSVTENLPYLEDRIRYAELPRYLATDHSECIWLTSNYNKPQEDFNESKLAEKISNFLKSENGNSKLLILNCNIVNNSCYFESLLQTMFKEMQLQFRRHVDLNNFNGIEYRFLHLNNKSVVLLPQNIVLSSEEVDGFILDHVDTVIGVTGVNVIHAKHIVKLLTRPVEGDESDQIVFVSGSSKDYEFKGGIAFLDALMHLHLHHENDALSIQYKEQYQNELTVLFNADKRGIDFNLQHSLRINKYIYPDIGTSFLIELDGRQKVIHLLANGMVINFFAKHEKGAKSEYIDPIVTLQLLSVVRFAHGLELQPALYDAATKVGDEYIAAIWEAINKQCKPMFGVDD